MRFFRHSLSERTVSSGSDSVIGGVYVPSESSLNNVFGQCHCIAGNTSTITALLYGVSGWVVHHPDPDNSFTYDALWDTMVPKDTDVGLGALDLSTGLQDPAPEFEPGEPNIEQLMDIMVLNDNNQFYKRRKLVSFASSPVGFIDGSPDQFWAIDQFSIRSGKKVSTELNSVAMLGFSSPSLDDTTTTIWTTANDESEWVQVKYLEMVLEQAWMQLVGLVETGAETPWEDAAALVEDLLEPTVVEQTAGAFVAANWTVFTHATFDVSVPGRRSFASVSAG